MKLIIPMAGMGKRMRPHTLNTPKPLLMVAGKSIVERIIQNFILVSGKKIEEIHFVIGNFGETVEKELCLITEKIGAECKIHYQDQALGTGHAVFCAKEGLKSEVCVVFADTLYEGDIKIGEEEAIIWTKKVKDPEHYGVVLSDDEGIIKEFIEKPADRISDQAIVGMYYFKSGEQLQESLNDLIDKRITIKGEYQITDALESMLRDGVEFRNKELSDWLDFGNKKVFLESIQVLLRKSEFSKGYSFKGSNIIPPVYIGNNVTITESTVGPNVIIEDNTEILNSEISNSRTGCESVIDNSRIHESLIGNHCRISSQNGVFNIGDYNELEG